MAVFQLKTYQYIIKTIYFNIYELTLLLLFQDISLTAEEMSKTLDLRPFMNPSPYCVQVVCI